VLSNTLDSKHNIDLEKGLSNIKVAYNPDFGYENVAYNEETKKTTPWKLIADAVSNYPHFELSSKVLELAKKQKETFAKELQK
jgi:hypothetical protein